MSIKRRSAPVYQGQYQEPHYQSQGTHIPPFSQTAQTPPYETPPYQTQEASVGIDSLAGGTGPQPYFPSSGQTDPNQLSGIGGPPVVSEQVIGVQRYNVDNLRADGQQKLAEGDFGGAQVAFRQYLDLYPDAPDVGDVSFWLGESYFVKGGYADAADAYITSMRKAPNGTMAPEALVGLSIACRRNIRMPRVPCAKKRAS